MGFDVGQKFGDYSITALLGAGSMGRLYRVEHSLTKRTEAMKVLTAEAASEIQVKRFEREMRALARLTHTNIAALHNAIVSENQLILLMEYIEGETLESMFCARRLPLDTGLGYIRQILSALGYAHQQGVVHRDVTPANVLVTASGQVKLTDFGLSKSFGDALLTNCGEVLGSLPYLAPERLKGTTQPDRRSDIYSVGAILYEHLTGQKPFGANRRLAPVITDSEADPQAPSEIEPGLSSEWDEIIRRTLARDPAHRYQSAQEFLDAIAQFDQPTGVSDLPLPQLRALGIGVATFAALVLALAVSPAIERSFQPAPAAMPLPRLHIAPPAFAAEKTPPSPTIPVPTPQLAGGVQVQHPRRVARIVPRAPVATASTAPPTIVPAPALPAAKTQRDVYAPVAAESLEAAVTDETAPKKKGFWSKLNVFKKKNAAKELPQTDQP
jgi:serine/threonine-protein kinase